MMRRWIGLLLMMSLLFAGSVAPVRAAEPGSTFSWRVDRGFRAYTSLTYGRGAYIAVGSLAGLWTSTDGKMWKILDGTQNLHFLQALVVDNELLVVGPNGLSRSKPDGSFTQVLAAQQILSRVFEQGGRVFVRTSEGWFSSADGGINWARFTNPDFSWVAYQNGIWLRWNFRTSTLSRSSDGQAWTDVPVPAGQKFLYGTAASGRFVTISEKSKSEYQVWTSQDGLSWAPTKTHFASDPNIDVADGKFLMTARLEGKVETYLYTSSDGESWTGAPLPFDSRIGDLNYLNGHYIALTYSGAILQSADGTTWVSMTSEPRGHLNGVAWGNGTWVAAGEYGSLLSSKDGQSWVVIPSETLASFLTVTWAGDQFVVPTRTLDGQPCYDKGECRSSVYTSKDGTNWDRADINSPGLASIARGKGRYVGVDSSQTSWVSVDGKVWRKSSPVVGYLSGVTYLDGVFLAIGYHDQQFWLYRSMDGEIWKEQPVPSEPQRYQELSALNGHFVLHGSKDSVYYSVDGLTWAARPTFGPNVLEVAAGGPWYVATVRPENSSGMEMALSYSPDGAIWIDNVGLPGAIHDLDYGAGRFVGVGDGGMIISWQITASDAAPCQTPFTDLPGALCPVVQFGMGRKAVGGYPDGTFQPDRGITRAEFTKMLGGTFYWKPEPDAQLSFGDTVGHWATTGGFIQPAVRRGALNGFPDGTFQPDAALTRGQLIKIALAAFGLKPADGPGETGLPADAWYTGWVAKARSVNVYGPAATYPLWLDGRVDPDRPATRAEALAVLYNLMHAGLK